MKCRFEDRLAGQALELLDFRERIVACHRGEVPAALRAIEAARAAGRWVGLLLDYELGEWLLPEATRPPPDETGPGPVSGQRPDDGSPRLTALVFDRARQETPWPAPDALDGHGAAAAGRPVPRESGAGPASILGVTPRMAHGDYVRRIAQIRELIARGELYQVNYTMPLDVDVGGDPQALYRRIAARHPVGHAAYVEDGARTVLSFSPELFVARQGPRLVTRPMKGTAPRHADPDEDRRLGQALRTSPKDRAENLMIVDLLRNDLGRLARPGSVRVDALFSLEQYPSVWTLTSTISADAPDAPLAQVLAALFPCGSITGAPKITAMRRIRRMEAAPRGLYCGSIGWLAPNGDFSLNVAIRTLVLPSDGATARRGVYHVGGGIVHDSDPEREWQECHWKARILG
ncbi:aminodeoxychorismate synthase [Bordetella ansorpii]|uniref:Aminodeoxychorismate synthase n=1 Tax=Bordetella ansorpii TaxID=288768 RepID=A0A157S665_9BORD|nr:aminodeoxychorismate synthase component I [Bordetella ansorpii]SAI65753.1 aminodeoxychorismate synthase [Bordetella ansorpii]